MDTNAISAGEGRTVWVVGDRYTIKASGEDTGGAFALFEAIVPPQAGPPPHVHHREDEAFYFLEVGREARDGEVAPVVPTPEDIEKLVAIAPKYGLEIRLPHS